MPLTLYHGEPNGPSLTVLAALFETGVDAELSYVDLARGGRHAAGVPHSLEIDMSIEGEGPVLVADGVPMADSVFLACYLDEVAAGGVRPADPYERWRMMAWCRHVIERIAPAAALLGNHAYPRARELETDAFETVAGAIRSADLAERWWACREGSHAEDRIEDSRTKIRQGVARVEKQLEGDWLFDQFSIADLETYAWLAGMTEIVPEAFADAPKTGAWLDRVKARPSVQRALALAKTDEPRRAWVPGPEINRWG